MENSTVVENKLKLLFITQDDPFYIRLLFEEFLRSYAGRYDIAGVVICSTMGKKSLFGLVKQMFNFYGPVDFVRMGLRFIAAKVRRDSLARLIGRYCIPVYRRNDVNSDAFINEWKPKNIHVIMSVAAPLIFKSNLLDLPSWGCLNIHHAKLPKYKGMMPNFWQMYHGEKQVWVSVHRMNPKIDEGDVIVQRAEAVESGESLDHLIKRTKRIGAHCIHDALEKIRNNRIEYLTLDKKEGSYFTFPTREQMREFRRRGCRIL